MLLPQMRGTRHFYRVGRSKVSSECLKRLPYVFRDTKFELDPEQWGTKQLFVTEAN